MHNWQSDTVHKSLKCYLCLNFMSRTDIVTEGTPLFVSWNLLLLCNYTTSNSYLPKAGWDESPSMAIPFQALQWTADILNYHLCTAGVLICGVFPWNMNSKWSFQKYPRHVEIEKYLFSYFCYAPSCYGQEGTHHMYTGPSIYC